MEWAPLGPQLASPVGPHVGFRGDTWAKLGLVSGLFTGYGVGPNWAPASKHSWAPRPILRGCVG